MEIDGKIEGARIASTAAAVTIYGLTLNDVVAILTIFWLALQIVLLIAKLAKGAREKWGQDGA